MRTLILRKGSTGNTVKELQKLLNQRLGSTFKLKEDGLFGMNTWRAVVIFQKKEWLVEDGQVGRCTWSALRQSDKYKILHNITLVGQQDSTACWLAVTSMLLRNLYPAIVSPRVYLTAQERC